MGAEREVPISIIYANSFSSHRDWRGAWRPFPSRHRVTSASPKATSPALARGPNRGLLHRATYTGLAQRPLFIWVKKWRNGLLEGRTGAERSSSPDPHSKAAAGAPPSDPKATFSLLLQFFPTCPEAKCLADVCRVPSPLPFLPTPCSRFSKRQGKLSRPSPVSSCLNAVSPQLWVPTLC